MKDKSAKKLSVNNLIAEHQKENSSPLAKQTSIANDNIEDSVINQDDLNAIFEYNSNITNFDPLYASIQPLQKILVRVFLSEPSRTEAGLLTPYKQTLPVPTQSGVGSLMEMESPWPYSNKAIVVAVPQMTSLKVGDVVQLDMAPVRIAGNAQNATIVVPSAYMHPDANTTLLSTNPSSKHYGYLLIPTHEISVKL